MVRGVMGEGAVDPRRRREGVAAGVDGGMVDGVTHTHPKAWLGILPSFFFRTLALTPKQSAGNRSTQNNFCVTNPMSSKSVLVLVCGLSFTKGDADDDNNSSVCWALESRKSKAAWNVTPGAREPGMFSSIFSLR